jgi:hypothetical protein
MVVFSRRNLAIACSVLATLSTLSESVSRQQQASDKANVESLRVVDNLPRYGPSSLEDVKVSDTNELIQWVIGILSVVVPFFVISILLLVVMPVWCCCRQCQCCCCKKTKRKKPLTMLQRWGPVGIMTALTIVMVVFAGLAYVANKDFSYSLVGDEGSISAAIKELFVDFLTFVDDSILGTIEFIENAIGGIVNGVVDLLGDTSIITTGVSDLITMMSNFGVMWSSYNVTTEVNNETYSFPCEFCTTIGGLVSNASDEISTQIGPIMSSLNNTVQTINSSLISVIDSIDETLASAKDQVQDVRDQLADYQDIYVDDAEPAAKSYNAQRELAVNILFALPLVPFIFVILGALCRKPICFTINYTILWITVIVMYFLLGIHLMIALTLNDGCQFIDNRDDNMTEVNAEYGAILQSCLDDQPISTAMDLGDLDFANQIEFPSLGNISGEFNFASFSSLDSNGQSLDMSTFMAKGDAALDGINNITNLTGAVYTRDNYSSINVTAVGNNPAEEQALQSFIDTLDAENASLVAFSETVDNIKQNLTAISMQIAYIKNQTEVIVGRVDDAADLLEPF